MSDANVSTTPTEPVAPAADGAPVVQPGTTTQERTFTQKELEAQLHDRLQRERAKYADYDTYKQAAARLKEIEDSQKTEQDKLQEKLSRLEEEYAAERQKRRAATLQSKIVGIAGRLGAVDPQDANFIMATQAIDPDGDGVDKEIETILETLKTTRPYLFAKPGQRLETFNPAEGVGVGATETPAQRRNRIAGGGGSIWDNDPAKFGGGVVINQGRKDTT